MKSAATNPRCPSGHSSGVSSPSFVLYGSASGSTLSNARRASSGSSVSATPSSSSTPGCRAGAMRTDYPPHTRGEHRLAHPKAAHLTEAELRAILAAEKDGHLAEAVWSPAYSRDGMLLSAMLQFAVSCLGYELLVQAVWRGEEEQQVFMKFIGDDCNLARLCVTASHNLQPHWHFLERAGPATSWTVQISDLEYKYPHIIDSTLGYFIDKQRITGIIRPGILS